MTLNIGGGFSYPMMGPMSGMGSGNMQQYFKSKYGCEDCFYKQPYWQELPKPVMPMPRESIKPSFWKRLLNKITG